jgi:hypothetical protein
MGDRRAVDPSCRPATPSTNLQLRTEDPISGTHRLWQVLTTMRDGKIVRIHDAANQAIALQVAGLPTSPVRVPTNNLAEVNMTDLHRLVLAGNVCCAGTLGFAEFR